MKNRKRILKRITAVALAVMMIGTTVDASALAVLAAEEVTEVTCNHVCDETCGGTQAVTGSALSVCTHVHDENCGYEEAVCTCETDDPAFHATNCPAYIAPENPQCYCAEKCTDDTLNVWCDVCGMQGVIACQGEDTATTYANTTTVFSNKACGASTNEGGAESVTCTFVWDFADTNNKFGILTISGSGAMADSTPYWARSGYDYRTPEGNERGRTINKVIVEEGITYIGDFAFYGCTYLDSVSLPSTLKGIGDLAFADCPFETIDIPSGVTSIGQSAFNGCSNLTSITIPEGVKYIERQAFQNCSSLTSVTIPDGVIQIGMYAFVDCTGLQTVSIPSSIQSIVNYAFKGCTSLTTVNVPCSWENNPLYTFEEGVTVNIADHNRNANGACIVCKDGYATEPNIVSSTHYPELNDTHSGYYAIETMEQLCWFSDYVNKGNTSVNAVLTDDIVAGANDIWTPIGNDTNIYAGTFDGNNHTISGLYTNNELARYVGLFGTISGTVKNVGVTNVSFSGTYSVGGVCGENRSGTIQNCYSTGSITNGDQNASGVCGFNGGTIQNCHSECTVEGASFVGGVCGYNNGTIQNCYSTGSISSIDQNAGGVCGINNNSITNCYYLNGTYWTGIGGDGQGTAESKTENEFNSGAVAYLLNNSTSTGNLAWYQNLSDNTDSYPVLNDTHGTVYSVYKCDGTTIYRNVNEDMSHIPNYSASGNTITASCSQCSQENIGTIVISASDKTYDGTAIIAIVDNSVDGTDYSSLIVYKDNTGTKVDGAVNVGIYTANLTLTNADSTEVTASVEFTIAKVTPDIGTVSASNMENTLDVSQVVLSRSKETVPGTLSLADGTTLQYGTKDYTYVFTPNDNTNYETVTGTVSITITDTSAPTATYKVGTDEWKQFINTITFGHFCKDYTTVDITYSDEGSGVADKQYCISDVEITNTENIQWSEYTDTLNINATGKYYIYVRVTDNYGNVVIQNSEGIVVYAESVIAPTSHSCEYGEGNSLDVDISTNGNAFANLTDGSGNEIDTENYSIDGSTLTIKGEYLSDLDVGEYTYKICMNPLGVENTEATLAYSFVVKVTAKELTVTGATATSRDYIANDKTVDITGVTLSGKQGTDDVSVEITGLKGTLSSANAGTYTSVTLPTLTLPTVTLTGDDAENYVLVQPTSAVATNVTINKATPPALTIPTATTITYGEKLSASTLSDSSWAWVDGTIVPNAPTNYNAYIEVDDSNYDYTDVYGYDSANHRVVSGVVVTIIRATLTITANSYTIKVGEALPTYEYTVTGLVGDDTLPVDVTISCSATDSNAAGTYPITISGVASDALASLYAPIYVNGTLIVSNKEEQTITASDVTLTYGETKNIGATTNGNGAITYSTTSDVISVAADGTITALKAGTATVTITTAETADYAEATKTISVTVNKKKVAVPAVDTNGYIYTGTAQTYGVTSTDDYTVEGGVQTNAGEYPVTITLNNENYEWDGTLGTYEFVINKVAITVTAKNYSIKVSETLPTYAYEVAGLVNGETLPIDVTISCNATNSNTAGTYTITVSGAVNSANYLFTYVNGTLIVSNKEEQTIAASDVTLTYGETGKKITATTNGDGAITYTVATGTDVISVAADGTITVLKAGTATVTIRAAETADYAEAIKTISVTVSACSHRYTSKVTKQPSYTEKGEKTYTCNCGHSYTEELPKLQPSSGGNNGGGGGTSGSGTPEPTATPIPTATPKPTATPIPTATPKPTPAPEKLPHIQDEDGKSGWDVIGDEIEKTIEDAEDSDEKAVVTVDMNGTTKVPQEIFEQIAGEDISVEFVLDNGLKWTVDGKSVKAEELKEIDFAVIIATDENPIESIPVKVINRVTGECTSIEIQLAHSGEFGFEAVLTVDLDEKNAGLYANLFFYNEGEEELEFICADVIAEDGTADLTFTHASDYLIVLSEDSMEPGAEEPEEKEPEVKEPVLKKGYTVQIGAFSKKANAEKWEKKGEAVDVPMFIIEDGKFFKVQTDVFETKAEAEAVAKKLAAAGLDTFILKTERWVTPEGEEAPEVPVNPETPVLPPETDKKTIEALAKEVIEGKWGNGTERKERLTAAGYDYKEVQNKVNELLK